MIRFVIVSIILCAEVFGGGVEHIILNRIPDVERAEIYIWRPDCSVRAVLIFSPGHNGSGQEFVENPDWHQFARRNKIALCGLSFASDMRLTQAERGYSYANLGSGELLIDCLDREFGGRKMPLLLYGYSAGARFTASFVAWKPDRVKAWCATGVSRWPSLPPRDKSTVPGLVACGDSDLACYWNSLLYFQSGREIGFPWCWISLKNLGHSYSTQLDEYLFQWFQVMLDGEDLGSPVFVDICTKNRCLQPEIYSIFTGWLPPDERLIQNWCKIHDP